MRACGALMVACLLLIAAVPTDGQASLAWSCNQTVRDLFAPGYNVTHALRQYDSADAAARAVIPQPGIGFTLFLPANAAFGDDSVALSDVPHAAVAAEAERGLPATKRASVWLYSMLPTAHSANQLAQPGTAETVLGFVVAGPREPANASYALQFALFGSLLTGQKVLVYDMLGRSARIVASYTVCSTMVHISDGLLWPAASASIADVPDPVTGGVFRDPLAAMLPNASQNWSAVAISVMQNASNMALPPATPPPALVYEQNSDRTQGVLHHANIPEDAAAPAVPTAPANDVQNQVDNAAQPGPNKALIGAVAGPFAALLMGASLLVLLWRRQVLKPCGLQARNTTRGVLLRRVKGSDIIFSKT